MLGGRLSSESAARAGIQKRWIAFVSVSWAYQFPTHDSVIISCALMVRFRCIRGTKIVHATRNSRIPRSGCRFDRWNPALRPLIRGLSGSAELSATRQQAVKVRNAESSVSY